MAATKKAKQPPPKANSASPSKKVGAKGKDPIMPFAMRKISSPGRPGGKNVVQIKLAIIPNFAIGIHIAYQRPCNRSPFAEHLLWKATQEPQSDWAQAMAFCPDRYFRHIDDEIQKHFRESSYHMRYFTSEMAPPQVNEELTEETFERQIRDFAEYAAEKINAAFDPNCGDAGRVVVPEDFNELLWNRNAVLSELIGTEGAARKLRRWLGDDWNGDFQENVEYYRAFFKEGTIPGSLQQFLNAPDSEIVNSTS